MKFQCQGIMQMGPCGSGVAMVPLLFILFASVVANVAGDVSQHRHDSFRKQGEQQFLASAYDNELTAKAADVVKPAVAPASDKKENEDQHKGEGPAQKLREDADKTIEKVRNISPMTMMKKDFILFKDYMMPGKRPDIRKKTTEFCFVIGSILWLLIYKQFIYQPDREASAEKWGPITVEERKDDPRLKMGSTASAPDLVLVFHNPDFDYKDKEAPVTEDTLKGVLPCVAEAALNKKVDCQFKRTLDLTKKCHKRGLDLGKLAAQKLSSLSTKTEEAVEEEVGVKSTTLGDVRAALLQDVYQYLPKRGFEVDIFNSVDGDELYVCIALRSEAAIQRLLQFHGMKLQLKQEVVPALGIDQDPAEWESSPPYVEYSNALCSNVFPEAIPLLSYTLEEHKKIPIQDRLEKMRSDRGMDTAQWAKRVRVKGQDDRVIDTASISKIASESFPVTVELLDPTDFDFFQVFGQHTGTPMILAGQQRVRCIYEYLNRYINLDSAVSKKFLVQWYPAHNTPRIAQLQHTWARWSLVKDLSCVQPVTILNDYFASRVTFIFAWNGMYAKMLLALIPIAMLFMITNSIFVTFIGTSDVWNRGSVLGLSIVIALWARMSANLWQREQEYLINAWDLEDAAKDRALRPDFAGEMVKSLVDNNEEAIYYPGWKYKLRITISWLITLAFTTLNVGCVLLWIDANEGRLTPAASIVQAIQVQIFTQTFNWMGEALTIAENHKYQDDFYDSYLKKQFIFQFVNQYAAFLYVAVKQQFTPWGCINGDCVAMIRSQLPVTLAVLAVMRIVQVYIQTLQVKFKLWWEARSIEQEGKEKPVYSFVEEQGKFGSFRIREQIEVMTQLTLTLGYVLIFGATAPLIIPLVCLVFMIQMRASGVLLTTAAFRTVPRMALGIGPWRDVVKTLLVFGVMFGGYLLVQFGPLFAGTTTLTKLTCLCGYGGLIALLWSLVDLITPAHSSNAEILRDRRHHVKAKLTEKSENAVFQKLRAAEKSTQSQGPGWFSSSTAAARKDTEDKSTTTANHIDDVEGARWSKIPKPFNESTRRMTTFP